MIKINTQKKNDLIEKVVIQGHSGYSESGSDIVCASVSSISITSVNAILKVNENAIFYKQDEGFLEIVINEHNKIIDLLLENMIELLEELASNYSKYVKIIK